MTKHYHLIQGDCVEVMRSFTENSIDCVVTDPPYGIGFMGKDWDRVLPKKEAFQEMVRVLKPGALAFVMSSPRQDVLWRMLRMLEECGFILRQSFLSWIYKSGFPKAYDVSLGIDVKFIRETFMAEHGRKPSKDELKKLVKEKRKVIGIQIKSPFGYEDRPWKHQMNSDKISITTPASDLAKKWSGWKSVAGLKPALECILMIYKPLSEKTIVDNVLRHGTGAINVDACRIPFKPKDKWERSTPTMTDITGGNLITPKGTVHIEPQEANLKGRFPANVVVSDETLDTGLGDQSRYFDLDAWAEYHGFGEFVMLDPQLPMEIKHNVLDRLKQLGVESKNVEGI